MKITKYLWSVSLLLAGMFGFHSCDEETYDVTGNPDNLIFLKTNSNFDISRFPTGGAETVRGDEVVVKIPVFATRPVDGEVSVSAEIDASLVEQYNTANSVEYSSVDESLIVWKKKTVKFLPGAYVASDSIEFSIPKESCVNFEEKSYLIPVRLTESSGCNISLNNRYSYAVVTCEYTYIDSEVQEMPGVELTDKSYWEVTSDDSSADLSVCLDGDLASYTTFGQLQNPTVTVDLKSIMHIQGAKIYTANGFSAYLSNLSWSVSSDGESWTDICALTDPTTTSDGYRMALLGTFDARYLKFSLKWSWGGWGGSFRQLGEISVYVAE
ncbi:DUF1735 domain-containing protein [Phocaeicola sp. HCN-40430]|uniref:BT_3987 domain-containing protein n=1 Tax=Phocaeicola sp. HCN-40430 TaxID=3134664 RepID=UPI0030C507F2